MTRLKQILGAATVLLAATLGANGASLQIFGDSISVGYGVPSGHGYVPLLGTALGLPVVNHAVLGAQAGDQAFAAYSFAPSAADTHVIMVGPNDQWKYGTDLAKRAYFRNSLRALILSVAAPNRVVARAMTTTGSWINTPVNNIGTRSTVVGSSKTAVVSGTAVYVGVIMQNDPQTAGSAAEVKIDGVSVGTLSSNGAGATTYNGLPYPPGAVRFGGLADGPHTVEVKLTTGGLFYLDYIAGSGQAAKPKAFVSNIIRMGPAGYASLGVNGASDQNVANYNADIAVMLADMAADGLDVALVDNWSVINPTTDLQPDGIHPLSAGHQNIKVKTAGVIQNQEPPPPPPPPPPPQWSDAVVKLDANGDFYIFDGADTGLENGQKLVTE